MPVYLSNATRKTGLDFRAIERLVDALLAATDEGERACRYRSCATPRSANSTRVPGIGQATDVLSFRSSSRVMPTRARSGCWAYRDQRRHRPAASCGLRRAGSIARWHGCSSTACFICSATIISNRSSGPRWKPKNGDWPTDRMPWRMTRWPIVFAALAVCGGAGRRILRPGRRRPRSSPAPRSPRIARRWRPRVFFGRPQGACGRLPARDWERRCSMRTTHPIPNELPRRAFTYPNDRGGVRPRGGSRAQGKDDSAARNAYRGEWKGDEPLTLGELGRRALGLARKHPCPSCRR